jgi:hypothetical protein
MEQLYQAFEKTDVGQIERWNYARELLAFPKEVFPLTQRCTFLRNSIVEAEMTNNVAQNEYRAMLFESLLALCDWQGALEIAEHLAQTSQEWKTSVVNAHWDYPRTDIQKRIIHLCHE